MRLVDKVFNKLVRNMDLSLGVQHPEGSDQDLDELEQKYIDVPEAPRDEQKTIGYDSVVSAEIVEDYEHPTFDVI